VTLDYLNFPSKVRFEDKSERKHFKLPAIQLCTKIDIVLDRNKVMTHFNLSEELSIRYKNISNRFDEQKILCKQESDRRDCLLKPTRTFNKEILQLDKLILERIDYKQMKEKFSQVIISAKNYIKCSGEVHTENSYRKEVIDDCEKYSQVIGSIHQNEFGVCFTYFSDRISLTNSSFTLKDNDFIEFEIDSKNLDNIMF